MAQIPSCSNPLVESSALAQRGRNWGRSCEKPEDLEQLAALTELLLEAKQNDLRRGRLQFAQRCFDYEATVETVKEIPWIRAYMQSVMDNKSLSGDEKSKKVNAMLFHWSKEVKAGNVK